MHDAVLNTEILSFVLLIPCFIEWVQGVGSAWSAHPRDQREPRMLKNRVAKCVVCNGLVIIGDSQTALTK